MIKKIEKGQILYIVAIAMVVMLGFTALGIDSSIVFKARRTDQSIADAAALAGSGAAGNYIKGYPGFTCGSSVDTTAQNLARAKAVSTAALYVTAAGTAANLTNGSVSGNNGVVTACLTDSDGAAYITVNTVVSSSVNTYFLKVITKAPINTKVSALSKVTSSTLGSILLGNGLVSLAQSGCGITINSAAVAVNGGGIFDNSDICGSCTPSVTTSACTGWAGDFEKNSFKNCFSVGGAGVCSTKPAQLSTSYIQTMFSVIPTPPTKPTCYTSITKSWTIDDIIAGKSASGVYCFPTGTTLTINSGTYTTTANVKLVFQGTSYLKTPGSSVVTLNFGSLEVYEANGGIYFGGASINVPNTFRYYGTGTTGGQVYWNGGQTAYFGDAFFYLTADTFYMQGSDDLTLKAPTSGPYIGIIVYQPLSNTNQVTLRGGSGMSWTGSFLAPGAFIDFEGSSATAAYNSQIVGNTILIKGGNTVNITYDAGLNYNGGGKPIKIDLVH